MDECPHELQHLAIQQFHIRIDKQETLTSHLTEYSIQCRSMRTPGHRHQIEVNDG